MPPSIDLHFLIVIVIAVLGIVVSAILYYLNKDESFSARILALYIFFLSIISLAAGAYHTNFYLHYPQLSRVVVFLTLSLAPLLYLYVRTVLEQQLKFYRTDALLFLPAVLYTLSYVPYYLLPTEEKLVIIQKLLKDKSLIGLEPEGMLPLGWGIMLRMGYSFSVTIAQFILVVKWRKKILHAQQPIRQNIETYQWLFTLTLGVSATFLVLFFEYLFQVSRFYEIFWLIALTTSGTILIICVYLFTRPNILYGLQGWLQEPEPAKAPINENEAVSVIEPVLVTKKNTLSLEQEKLYKEALEKHFEENIPYIKPGYRIMDLAGELGIPHYQLSAFINQEYGKNFNELVNENRVAYLEKQLKISPHYHQYTLEALGKSVGFKSRTAFIAAVKKKTGKPPLDYFGKAGQSIYA